MSETSRAATTQDRAVRRTALAVALTFGLQGAGYAVVVTALPSFQRRLGIDDTATALLLLAVCVAAAGGSVLADLIAVRRSSRHAVIAGFTLQAIALTGAALAPSMPLFVAAILAYGVGLGLIDASSNMQGVLVQRRHPTPLLGRFYATYTTGAILGALAMSGGIAAGGGAAVALLVTAGLQLGGVAAAGSRLDRGRAAHDAGEPSRLRRPLPRRTIVVVGLVVLVAFTMDSAVSAWSTSLLTALGAAAALAPMGYAAYQGGVLVARLVIDPLQQRVGRRVVMVAALTAGAVGGVVVALGVGPGVAVAGFAVTGLAVGGLVPIAFGLAGRIEPARTDEVIARVNQFNYAGAVLGAVGVGLLLDLGGLGIAFLMPVVLLAAALPAVRSTRAR